MKDRVMTVVKILRKFGAAVGIAALAGLAGCTASAQTTPAAAAAPATEADYPAFRVVLDRMGFYAFFKGAMLEGVGEGDHLDDLTPTQRTVFLANFDRQLDTRRETIMSLLAHAMLTHFSHDEVVRLNAVSARPFMTTMASALEAFAKGDSGPLNRLGQDPDAKTVPQDDIDLLGRVIEAMTPSLDAVGDEVRAALVASMGAAKAA